MNTRSVWKVGVLAPALFFLCAFSPEEATQRIAGRWQGNGWFGRDAQYRVTFEPRADYAIIVQPSGVTSGKYSIAALDARTFRIVLGGQRLTIQFDPRSADLLTVVFDGDDRVTMMARVPPKPL